MSRIGNKQIDIPSGVTIAVSGDEIKVKGPKGELSQSLVPNITVNIDGNVAQFVRGKEDPKTRAAHGLMRALTANMVTGVTTGFSRKLLVDGVGYRADVKGSKLVMNLGYSHPVEYEIPGDIKIEVAKDNSITISGIDKQRVGQVAAVIRAFRPPNRYKGKGVKYSDEVVRLKAGKSA